ncbi:MAG TPA: transposase [Elusimicrobiales bacterium]|nr:transposase [Elusimicrobiales bacterium]
MRTARIQEPGSYYHIVSRVIDRRMLFALKEKERFRDLLHRVVAFSGVHLLTYAILDNHFHLLVQVPLPQTVDDATFLARMALLYPAQIVKTYTDHLGQLRAEQNHVGAERLKAPFVRRMYSLSLFMKTLKQRLTQSYNQRHGRKGTLWEARFKSLMTEGAGSLAAVAAYIDLNAVRAGLVDDPKDYRFCGYAEAVAGLTAARKGLVMALAPGEDWSAAAAHYRTLLYLEGEQRVSEDGRPVRRGIDPEQVRQVVEAGGELALPTLLRCRVRYFTDGVVLGSRNYVDGVFQRHRGFFSSRRTTGARKLRHSAGLYSARRLRLDVIAVPG